jgi:hypothetical protein
MGKYTGCVATRVLVTDIEAHFAQLVLLFLIYIYTNFCSHRTYDYCSVTPSRVWVQMARDYMFPQYISMALFAIYRSVCTVCHSSLVATIRWCEGGCHRCENLPVADS